MQRDAKLVSEASPRGRHARTQLRLASALLQWADRTSLGRVGTEWDIRIAPPGEERRTLVPDVAFLSYDRVPREAASDAEFPTVGPDVVVEVLSPDDRREYVEEKRRVYLACGAKAVIEADPEGESVTVHDLNGSRTFRRGDVLSHAAL
ncbi:MAG: Uma2 family endonuclease [Vulcanimicrobiaceae bacterium]